MLRAFALLLVLCILFLGGCGAMSPEAVAGPDQTITLGSTATLSAADSDKKNGEALTYRWSIVSAPAGSTAQLSDPASATPTFVPDLVGEYVFQLVVDNDWHKSDPVQVKVNCTQAPPPSVAPVVFATDPSGLITLLDLTAVENFRTATQVNLSLKFTLKNVGDARTNIGFTVRGHDGADIQIYSVPLSNSVNAGESKFVTVSFGEALTVAEFDSITDWKVDPITVNP